MNHRLAFWCSIAFLFTSSAGAPVLAEEEPPSPTVDPRASEVLQRCAQFTAGLQSFRVEVAMTHKSSGPGMKMESTTRRAVALRRPAGFASTLVEGMHGATVVCDGSKLHVYMPDQEVYVVESAPPDVDELFSSSFGTAGMAQVGAVLEDLIPPDGYTELMQGVLEARYLGTEAIEGAECHHLRFIQPEFDWDIWVEAGERPLLRRHATDISKQMAEMEELQPALKGMKMESFTLYRNWEVNPGVPDSAFAFTPPEGVTPSASVDEALGGGTAALVGAAAPPLHLDLLEGGQMDIAAHKGKDVVILDFWATSCGPCRKALPELAALAREYRERGVAVYAINLRESPDRIRRFMARAGLDIPVPMDWRGESMSAYRIMGIPRTVVIDKEGVVRSTHLGFPPGSMEKLRGELDSLLSGKPLTPRG